MSGNVNKCSKCGKTDHVVLDCPSETRLRFNCQEAGHMSAACPQPRGILKWKCGGCGQNGHLSARETWTCKNCAGKGHGHWERPKPRGYHKMKCRLCDEQGHVQSECTNRTKWKCRNCNGTGHAARECSKPRGYLNMTCRLCQELGHLANECTNRDKWQCTNCNKAGHKAQECEKPRGYSNLTCRRCQEIGHIADECVNREKRKCTNCNENGHFQTQCEKPRGYLKRKCNICKGVGHLTVDCPSRTCFKCGCIGHISRDCPLPHSSQPSVQCHLCGSRSHSAFNCFMTNGGDYHYTRAGDFPEGNQRTDADSGANRSDRDSADGSRGRTSGPSSRKPDRDDADMSSLWLQACAAFRSEDWGTAASSLTKAIDAGAQDAHFFEKRGQARLKMGQHECALGDFGVVMARKDYKAPTSILVDVARCRFHLGSPTSALIAVREAISMEPTHSGAKTLRHRIHELQGHMETYRGAFSRRHWHMARSSFESCLTIYNQEEGHTPIEISCWGVQLYIAERKWDNALTKVTDILRSRSSAVEAMVLHARILFLTAKLLEARKKVLDALKLDPDNDDARKLFSRIKGVDRYKEHGNESFRDAQWSDAVVWWEEALLLLGEDEEEGGGGLLRARLLLNQATANLKLKQCAEGIRHVDASLVLDASYYKAFRTRARLHYELELYEKAAEDFKAAIQYGTSELNARDLRALGDELARAELKAQREKKGKDYYKILGLSRNCTQAEIKKAYHLLSLKHHPDKGGVEEQFKLIVEAYSILSDNDERRKYERKSSSNRDDYEDAQ